MDESAKRRTRDSHQLVLSIQSLQAIGRLRSKRPAGDCGETRSAATGRSLLIFRNARLEGESFMRKNAQTKPAEKGDSPIMAQMKKLFKHTRTGSFATRSRYQKACKTFVSFLDEKYGMKNLRNLQDKHLIAYIEHRQSLGIADKTIKTDLGAIRYLHDMVPNAKYTLATNAALQKNHDIALDKTIAVSGDRAWTNEEYQNMQQLLNSQTSISGTAQIAKDVMVLARTMGLRVSEAVCMRRSQAEQALRTGMYTVQNEAKNGLHRDVPLSSNARTMLEQRLLNIARGARVFIQKGEKAHEVVNRIEKHVERYRTSVTSSEGVSSRLDIKGHTNSLTFHGLRYNYVQDRMQEEQAKGASWTTAAEKITKEVGHGRVDVIRIYTNGR